MQIQVGVKLLIKNSEGQYLFLKRSRVLSSETKLMWDIPGGRIEPGESLQQALVREVYEEIHYTLRSEPQLIAAQDIFVEQSIHVVRLTYVATEDVSAIVLSGEHEEYRWRKPSQVYDLGVDPYVQEVLNEYC